MRAEKGTKSFDSVDNIVIDIRKGLKIKIQTFFIGIFVANW